MTELGYLSNHFFDGINTHFGINTDMPRGQAVRAILVLPSPAEEHPMKQPDIATPSGA
jgi:hypothetical protein